MKVLVLTLAIIAPQFMKAQNTFPASGNVGIGTTSPTQTLHVQGRIYLNSNFSENGVGRNFFYWSGHSLNLGTPPGTYAHNMIDLKPGGATNGPLVSVFNMYSSPGLNQHTLKITLQSDGPSYFNGGHVGIGTSAIDNVQNWNKVLHLNGTGHAKLLVTTSNGIKTGIFSHDSYNGKIGTESNHNLTFTAGYWNDVMTLTTQGNVGIGTLTPAEKLSVNGNIRCKKVTVTLNGWADYVFEKDYELIPLPQLEKFIQLNKHLPDVPSAREVEEHGLDLGNNQATLLKKIEELTLYVIEQNKEIKSLEEKNKMLSNAATAQQSETAIMKKQLTELMQLLPTKQ